ncbi:MAG: flavodoxin family protein [Candidatus Coatesbacteria bacterium]|nr:MAG: flavodoxin family protein [Candidatus Coatesbacteria bacterium]
MEVVGVCGSPRVGGNSEQLLDRALGLVAEEGLATGKILLAGKRIEPCTACLKCRKERDGLCHGREDDLTPLFPRLYGAAALLLATPVYFGAATGEMVAFIDRLGYVSRGNGGLLNRKVGAPIVVARRAGQNFTVAQLNYFFLINGMVVPGARYWPVAFGGAKGDVQNDEEGLATVDDLARNVTWLVKLINA